MKQCKTVLLAILLLFSSFAGNINIDPSSILVSPGPLTLSLQEIKDCEVKQGNRCTKCKIGYALVEGKCEEPHFPAQCTEQECGYILPVFEDELILHPKKIKSDGKYLYYNRGSYMFIIDAYPAEQMAYLSEIQISFEKSVKEFYFSDRYLFVISGSSEGIYRYGTVQYTHVDVYDLLDKGNPILAYSYTLNGKYLSSKINQNGYLYVVATGRFSDRTRPYFKQADGKELRTEIKFNIRLDPAHLVGVLGTMNGQRLSILGIHKDAPLVQYAGIVEIQRDSEQINNIFIDQSDIYYTVPKQNQTTLLFKINLNNENITPYPKHTRLLGVSASRSFQFDKNLGVLKLIVVSADQYNTLYIFNSDLNPVGSIEFLGVVVRLNSLNRKIYLRMRNTNNSLRVFQVFENFTIQEGPAEGDLYGFSYNYLIYQEDRIIGFKRVIHPSTKAVLGFRASILDISDLSNINEVSRSTVLLDPSAKYNFIHQGALFSRVKNLVQLQYNSIKNGNFEFGSFYFYVDRNLVKLRQVKRSQEQIQNTQIIQESLFSQTTCYIVSEKISNLVQTNIVGVPC